MSYIKEQTLHTRKFKDRQFVIKSDGSIEFTPINGAVTVNGDLRVTGSSSGPTNSLTYYVSLEGNDLNDGLSAGADRAKRTIKSAVEAAPAGATIKVAPGNYYEDNPITLKERQTVRGDSLRNTQLWPLNKNSDYFYIDNACYLFQLTFRGLADPGWCVRIKPGALVTTSPYVQNCSNINGPWLNDGTEFVPFETVQIEGIAPRSKPIINDLSVPLGKRVNETGGGNGMLVDGSAYDQRSLIFSMVADAFTQIAQGGIGFHITNFGYTQIVSCFTVFCRTGFLTTNGGYLSISNSVSDFGTYGLVADGVFSTPYTTARPSQDYYSSVGSITINSQGSGYTGAPTVVIEPPTTPGGIQATGTASIDAATGKVTSVSIDNTGSGYDFIPEVTFTNGGYTSVATGTVNLVVNVSVEVDSLRDLPQVGSVISFDGDATKYYVTSTNVTTQPFTYNETTCRRDVQRIIEAVMGDVVLGTNYQSIAAGKSYLRSTSAIVLQQQLAATIYGIEAIRDEIISRIGDEDSTSIIEKFALITNILEQGDSTAIPNIDYNELVGIDNGVINAKDNIIVNREFIIDEITNYIAEQFTDLSYNQDKCERDVRLICQAVAYDVAFGTNYNTVTAGLAYQRANAANVTDKQLTQTLAAFTYLKTQILALNNVIISATATSRATTAMNELLDIISNNTPNALTFDEPAGVIEGRSNAKDQLIANRSFLQAEVIAWIAINYPSLSYDEAKCERDVGYIVDALTYDILYGGNTATRNAASSYFVGTLSQLGSNETTATINAYERLKNAVSAIVQGASFIKSIGNALTQDTSSGNATGVQAAITDDLIQDIIVVIEDGNLDNLIEESLPSVAWAASNLQNAHASIYAERNNFATLVTDFILATFPTFTYDRTKCKRDVDLIIDAVVRDIKIGTNFNGIQAGQAYRRGSASVVDADQLPATIIALRYLKTLILADLTAGTVALTRATDSLDAFLQLVEYGTLPSEGITYPSIGSASQAQIDAARQLQDNRTFLIEETIAWIADNYFVYDATRGARDIQIILDSIGLDLILGTNFNAVTAGIAHYLTASSYIISDQTVQTIAAITHLRSEVATLIAADANSVTRTNAAFNEIIDIIQNGIVSANALTWSDPGVNSNKRFAREQLQTNKTFIGTELTDWIDAQVLANTGTPSSIWYNFTYNDVIFRTDVGYIVDALSHDVQYGTNYGTRLAATSYFVNVVQSLSASQRPATAAAMAQLATIVSSIVQETYAGQNTSGTAATGTEGTEVSNLVGYVEDVIIAGELDSLPALIEPSTSWVTAGYVTSRNLIRSSGDSTSADIVQELIVYINENLNGLDYNETNCRRDTGYLIDSVTHDLLYGGNRASLISARAYFDAGILQVSDYEETSAALVHLRNVSEDVIEGIAVTPTTGNNESQSLIGGFGTSTQSTSSTTLYNIIIDALNAGNLTGTPSNSNPNYAIFVPTATLEVADAILDSSVEKQQLVIDYITDNIIGLTYNIEKCQRDTGYIIDAAVYDMMYGGNKQTRRAAEAYYDGAILGSAIYGTANQIEVTEFTYKRLAKVLSDVAQNIEISTSEGTTLTQTIGLGLSDGSSAAGSYVYTIVEKIAEVVKVGSVALPSEIDHSYNALGDAGLNVKRNTILAARQEIEDAAIATLNLEYGGVATLQLFPGILSVLQGTLGNMQNVSTVSTSGHSFEYVGAGITYNALPFFGGSPIEENQVVETNVGKVFSTSSDQIGNFAVGQFFNVNALTGAITLNANQLNLSGISAIGPFQRDGIPVGVELREVSNSTNLIASTGITESDTVPTQAAVVSYVENRYLNKTTGGTVIGNVTVTGNITTTGDVVVNGGDLTSTQSTFNLLNVTTTTLNIGGAATSVNIGAATGTTTVNNNVVIEGTTTINGDTSIIGDISLTIPDETQQAFSITEGTDDYVSIDTRIGDEKITFGSQPRVLIENNTEALTGTINTGSIVTAGGMSVAKNLNIGGDLYFEGEIISSAGANLSLFNNVTNTITAFGAATSIEFGSTVGTLTINNQLTVFDSFNAIQIPVGSIADRPIPIIGQIRFNSETVTFEGYDGIAWGSLGGVKDVDQNTYIIAETSPGVNNNELEFYTDSIKRMGLSTSELVIDSTINTTLEAITPSTSALTGALIVSGGVGINGNLYVGGRIGGDIQIGENITSVLTIRGETILAPDALRIITNAPDSAADDIVYPVTFAHHSVSGIPVVGSGTGVKFELETSSNNFETGGKIDVVVQDVTGAQEDFDMVFSTMINGSVVEKVRFGELTATFENNVEIKGGNLTTNQTTFNLLDTTATTVNFAGAGTTISIGDTTGTTTVNHNLHVTGTISTDVDLAVQYGGTGVSTFTTNGILYGDATDPVQVTNAAGTSDASVSFQILTVTSDIDATPVWTNTIDGGSF